ncbi:hypothetical protein [uncultured Thiocystis sp.]|jgi:hypothetical protein|uniref:PspA/IM30 family protein n=1 Tax=uncultured Thiocystis sp. TaxID=1202134 RepID=UPI0025F2E9E6|nr:hypothetical protein [uncultured Thiocystis sp.]
MKKRIASLVTGAALWPAWLLAIAATPVLPLTGELLGPDGAPLEGPRTLTFELYAAPNDGGRLWFEEQTGVTLIQGRFAVLLGGKTPFPNTVDWREKQYLEVKVKTGDGKSYSLNPRIEYSPALGALRAKEADHAQSATRADQAAQAESLGGLTRSALEQQIADLTNLVNGMKTELATVKTELVNGMKTELATVKTELSTLKTGLANGTVAVKMAERAKMLRARDDNHWMRFHGLALNYDTFQLWREPDNQWFKTIQVTTVENVMPVDINTGNNDVCTVRESSDWCPSSMVMVGTTFQSGRLRHVCCPTGTALPTDTPTPPLK